MFTVTSYSRVLLKNWSQLGIRRIELSCIKNVYVYLYIMHYIIYD